MKAINQTLSAKDMLLGNWYLWANDVQASLGKLTIIAPTKIPVKCHTSEYQSTDGQIWECQHLNTEEDSVEYCDEYMDAVTGIPQPVYYSSITVCTDCNAQQTHEGDWNE